MATIQDRALCATDGTYRRGNFQFETRVRSNAVLIKSAGGDVLHVSDHGELEDLFHVIGELMGKCENPTREAK